MKKFMYGPFCSISSISWLAFSFGISDEAMSFGGCLYFLANEKQGNAKSPRWGSGGVSNNGSRKDSLRFVAELNCLRISCLKISAPAMPL